ncbi:hypothetical protein MASR1M60_04180 [Rhodocyclaceae bacterium]
MQFPTTPQHLHHTPALASLNSSTPTTYVVQGDGVAGMQDSDILVKLTGVTVTDLGAIII